MKELINELVYLEFDPTIDDLFWYGLNNIDILNNYTRFWDLFYGNYRINLS